MRVPVPPGLDRIAIDARRYLSVCGGDGKHDTDRAAMVEAGPGNANVGESTCRDAKEYFPAPLDGKGEAEERTF